MTESFRTAGLAFLLLAPGVLPATAEAQKPHRVTRPASELLAAFAGEYQTPQGPTKGAGTDVAHVLTYPQDYSPAELKRFQEGLERLALSGETPRLRSISAISLSELGSRRKAHPAAGTVARLQRIYQRSNDPLVRASVVLSAYDWIDQPAALTFLERIAKQVPGQQDFPAAASNALGTMALMGPEGREVLARLHRSGVVKDPDARLGLENMAKRGYQVSPSR